MSRVAETVEQVIKKSLGKTKFGINDGLCSLKRLWWKAALFARKPVTVVLCHAKGACVLIFEEQPFGNITDSYQSTI